MRRRKIKQRPLLIRRSWKDKFNLKAKREGYRARSAYKLLDLQSKYKLMKSGDVVLDIGAAPGSWLQVAREFVGATGLVVGVDLVPIRPMVNNIKTLVLDIEEVSAEQKIAKIIKGKAKVVLCDVAPSTTGARAADQYASIQLSEKAFELAKKFIAPKGNFVCKVFQGEGFESFYKNVKTFFLRCKSIKPVASKKASKEIYLVGLGFNGE